MKIVLVKPYGIYAVGAALDIPQSDVATQLIRRGIARADEQPKAKDEPKPQPRRTSK